MNLNEASDKSGSESLNGLFSRRGESIFLCSQVFKYWKSHVQQEEREHIFMCSQVFKIL